MAPGAFERAHSSPRADADAGPAGGTAPDSPRAFLAAMEDGVYGRPGEAGGWSVSQAPPRTAPHWRGAFQRAGRASGAAESRGSRAIVWAEPASGGGGRGGAGRGAGRGVHPREQRPGFLPADLCLTPALPTLTQDPAALACLYCVPQIQTTVSAMAEPEPRFLSKKCT